jgi:serine/threonine protein kinase
MNALETARCPHCFGATRVTPCPHCGWQPGHDNLPPALALGQLLDGRYRIGRVLGHGGFGITYLAWDDNLHLRLAIKEYLPRDCASRAPDGISLAVYPGPAGEQFAYGLDRFLEEARTLAHFDQHPGIVTVKNFFRAHGTGYCVMDYVEGITLRQYLDQQPGGRISIDAALKLLMPVADALRAVHKEGLLHRDIAPDNIYLTQDGRIKLLDFGAARFAAGEHSKSLSIILKPGYAPEEQYRTKGQQGPWTDVYGLAATLYRTITGLVPPEALDRWENDELIPPSKLSISTHPEQEAGLLKGLAVKARHRYQSMAELQEAWRANGFAARLPEGALSEAARVDESVDAKAKPKNRVKTGLLVALAAGLLIVATVALVPWPGIKKLTTLLAWAPPREPTEQIATHPISTAPAIPTAATSTTPLPTPPTPIPSFPKAADGEQGTPDETEGPNAKSRQAEASTPAGSNSPSERYRLVGNDQSIVEDTSTNLQWKRCSQGQTWNGTTCVGQAKEYAWKEARRIAPEGWRLPKQDELVRLVYCSSGHPAFWPTSSKNNCEGDHGLPAIWGAAFPNTPPDSWFWASSPDDRYPNQAWLVYFGNSYINYDFEDSPAFVRLVRSGSHQEISSETNASPPQSGPVLAISPPLEIVEKQPTLTEQPVPCDEGIADLERRFNDALDRFALTTNDKEDTAKANLEKVLINMRPDQRCQWNGMLSDSGDIKANGYRRISDRYADLAERELKKEKIRSAMEWLNMAEQYDGKNPRLESLRRRVNAVPHDKTAKKVDKKRKNERPGDGNTGGVYKYVDKKNGKIYFTDSPLYGDGLKLEWHRKRYGSKTVQLWP